MSVKKKQLEPPHDPMPNMTAMVDLVMCVLIFFMLGSKFLQPESFLPSSMPVNLGMGDSASTDLDTSQPLILDLQKGGGLGLVVNLPSGERSSQIRPPSDPPRDEAQEQQMMSAYMGQVVTELKARKKALGKVRVVLRPRGDLEYRHIAAVFGACADADFNDIVFAVNMGGSGGSSILR